jgi:hypothetical protein
MSEEGDLFVSGVRSDEPGMQCIPPKNGEKYTGDEQDQSVEGNRYPLNLTGGDVFRQHPGGEGKERDEEQQQQVEPQQRCVGAVEVVGDGVVPEP